MPSGQITRISISRKKRFEIFKRDGFKCQYCGAYPPNVTLEVDHLTPVCAGGDNAETNLITSCFDCNRGKGTYKLAPSGDGAEGTLEFGPIASTMMMCPQPSLDGQVGKALSNVRTFLIKDGQLHLSQEADSGVLTWKRG